MEQKEFEDKPIPIPLNREDMEHILASLYLSSEVISSEWVKDKSVFRNKSERIIKKILNPYVEEKLPRIHIPRITRLHWRQIDIDSVLLGAVLTFMFVLIIRV